MTTQTMCHASRREWELRISSRGQYNVHKTPAFTKGVLVSESTAGRILVVDDELDLVEGLESNLSRQGYQVTATTSPKEALRLIGAGSYALLLSDMMMPELDGLLLMQEALKVDPQLVAIIMTGQATVQTAVDAMKIGAFDYLVKPFKFENILPIIVRALNVHQLRMENVSLRHYVARLTFESKRHELIGRSAAIQRVKQLITKVAPTDSTVLIRGDTGTGKELVARALHYNSSRRAKALVTVNCAALQENLLESELFGHEKGSFTGATQAKPGLIEVAQGGTLFIDEVSEMSPPMQAKLLRVLENGHYRRVGSTQESHADLRVIAATNKPLEEEQKSGRFREDLFYRLNVVTIPLSPLRDRREDIPILVDHFLTTRQLGKVKYKVESNALDAMVRYNWPGNIRELVNVLERAQILAEENVITVDDLPENMILAPVASGGASQTEDLSEAPDNLEAMERRHVQGVLQRTHFNKVVAAKALGISRRSLYRLIEKYQLDPKLEADRTPPT
jgi:DNA-binding NtrC family response regulator